MTWIRTIKIFVPMRPLLLYAQVRSVERPDQPSRDLSTAAKRIIPSCPPRASITSIPPPPVGVRLPSFNEQHLRAERYGHVQLTRLRSSSFRCRSRGAEPQVGSRARLLVVTLIDELAPVRRGRRAGDLVERAPAWPSGGPIHQSTSDDRRASPVRRVTISALEDEPRPVARPCLVHVPIRAGDNGPQHRLPRRRRRRCLRPLGWRSGGVTADPFQRMPCRTRARGARRRRDRGGEKETQSRWRRRRTPGATTR